MLQWFKNFLQTSPLPHSNTVQGYFLPTAPEKQQMEHFWWLRNPVDIMHICCECLTVASSSAKLDKVNLSLPDFFLSTGSTGRKPRLILLLGYCLLSPSVTDCHFACGKNGHSFHRISRGVTSWENVSC